MLKVADMKRVFLIAFIIFFLTLKPSSLMESIIEPVEEFELPSNIMVVRFRGEVWTYRLYEDGVVKKIVERR